MRLIRDPQTTFRFEHTRGSGKDQWEKIATILESDERLSALLWQDLTRTCKSCPRRSRGAKGMTAEQVLRFAVVKVRLALSYRELFERVDDSIVLRAFCLMPFERIPAFTTLQENIKRIRPRTWADINAIIISHAVQEKVEAGMRIRVDSTAVASNIHHPTDSGQLWDCVRVLTRLLRRVETEFEFLRGRFSDHTRVAKKLRYKINNTRGRDNPRPHYKRLVAITAKTVGYARCAVAALDAKRQEPSFEQHCIAQKLKSELEALIPLAEKVMEQSTRRVLNGEAVPASEKVLSIFEPHTDIIAKGQREITYGHKVFLSAGTSNLILDCTVEKGNPADAEQFMAVLERHCKHFENAPQDVAADGGFASKANATHARQMGVRNIAFSALKGNALDELVRDTRTYKQLRKWRAGIEAIISTLKRAFGMARCTWRNYESFQSYVQLAVLAFNLQTLARHLL